MQTTVPGQPDHQVRALRRPAYAQNAVASRQQPLCDRMEDLVERIVADAGHRTIAIVAHGGTNRVLLCRALGLPPSRLLAFGQDYGALSVLERTAGGWVLWRLNEPPAVVTRAGGVASTVLP